MRWNPRRSAESSVGLSSLLQESTTEGKSRFVWPPQEGERGLNLKGKALPCVDLKLVKARA